MPPTATFLRLTLCDDAALTLCNDAALNPAGAQLLWGGQPLEGHSIPACYGAIQPTAVFVPLAAMRDPEAFKLVTTEVFGPFQVVTEYDGERAGELLLHPTCVPWWSAR